MVYPRKPPHLKTGHSNGVKNARSIGILPARREPAPVPAPPRGLQAKSKQIWKAYWSSQVSEAADHNADMHRIVRWIQQVDEYDRVSAVFRKTRLVKGSQGQPVLNPLAGYLAQLETQISRAENEMGLTPLARLRLGITFGEASLTALELNRQLEALSDGPSVELADVEGEWEAV